MEKKFKDISSEFNYVEMEENVLSFWDREDIFHRTLHLRAESKPFVFYEGPPTANGLPGVHHALARVFKDITCRYQTMKGHLVDRKAGWDCHGLPVELEVEKRLGLSSKSEIENYGIDKFNKECRESVLRYTKEWEELTRRIGFWVDTDNAYATFTDDYIESLWWALKELWNKDLLYEGHKVVPYCPRCGTSLSSHEVAQGYATVKDPSIYVKFKQTAGDGASAPARTSADDGALGAADVSGAVGTSAAAGASATESVSFLVWTTTPWTLAGNVALAVHPDLDYVKVRTASGELLILAEALTASALSLGGGHEHDDAESPPVEIIEKFKGSELIGRRYEPILPYVNGGEESYRVVAGDFVTTSDGTGIVHIAPAYGEDDMRVGVREKLPVLHPVNLQGNYIDEVTPWAGMFVKDADPLIIEALKAEGKLWKALLYEHTYPFCWRCDTPLLYYAKASWFIRTTALRDRLVELNKTINWVPEHIRDGRFGQWLENLIDWALSRERYWGTPLPIWRCPDCGKMECIGSIAELKEKAIKLPEHLELHRPYVDEVILPCECGGEMTRTSEVIDAWFDSGAMPVAQWHYPFENQDRFEQSLPADFISEGIDQTRGWFFSLHALSTLLFDKVAYKNVISLGHILDENGEKMSKHKGNVVQPWTVLNAQGADALRWYLFTMSPPGSPKKFSQEGITEVLRKFLLTLWNTYSFFITYANIDGFDPMAHSVASADRPLIDRWLISAREELIQKVGEELDDYNITGASRRIALFVDDLSNWYVRRGRRRFWKSEEDTDKISAYLTLYETLVALSKLLAPFTPFISEEIYLNLVAEVDADAPPSVHMADFPAPELSAIDEELEAEMDVVRQIVSLGRAARTRSRVKVRQPLSQLWVTFPSQAARRGVERLSDQIFEELNIKEITEMTAVEDFFGLIVKPNLMVLGRRLGPKLPALKAALDSADPFQIKQSVQDGGVWTATLDGEQVELGADDLLFEETSREEFVVESGNGIFVALSLEISPELRQEGLAREFVHFIQNARKEAGFQIEDKIVMSIDHADPEITDVLQGFQSYILGETLTEEIILEAQEGFSSERTLDGHAVKVTLATR